MPPSDIDTSGWLTYRDAEHGFELRYPPEGRLQQHTSAPTFGAVGFGAEIDLPFPEGTTLEAKYLFIQQASGLADQCVPSKLRNALARGLTPDVQLITSATARFWRTELLSAGAMHGAHTTLYMASHASICITLSAVLAGVSPLAYSTPPPSPDAQEESKIFDAIVSTFRWID